MGQANTWESLGHAHHRLGDHAKAVACYHNAIDLLRDVGDRHLEGIVHIHLGDTHHAAGNPHAARTAWHEAIAILDNLDDTGAEEARGKLIALPPYGPVLANRQ